jgi:hypothetical protein
VTGGWRKLYNQTLHIFHSSPIIIRIIRSGNMRWTGHVEWILKMRNAYKMLVLEDVKEREYLGDVQIEGRILLIWI